MGSLVKKQMASAVCDACGQAMKSERPGHFVACSCGESFVDTDRWDANRHRYGGAAIGNDKGNWWIYGDGIKTHMEKFNG